MEAAEFKSNVFPLKNKLFRIALRMLENAEDAQDVVQDVFVKLWNRKEQLDEYRSIEALAVVTTRNLCLDRIKTRKLPAGELETLRLVATETASDEMIHRKDTISRIREIIGRLPETQKTVMQLRDMEGYEYETIGEMLGMNLNAVRVNLTRARKKVRDTIQQLEQYEYHGN